MVDTGTGLPPPITSKLGMGNQVSEANTIHLAIHGAATVLRVKDGFHQYDLTKQLHGEILFGKAQKSAPDLDIGNVVFRAKEDYFDWLTTVRERQLSKLPTEVGGICIDFLEVVLAGLTEEGDRLAAFQQYKDIHYEIRMLLRGVS